MNNNNIPTENDSFYKEDVIRINLWSGPRNISTALMYSFAQRNNTTVVDEPLYAHYLTHTDAKDYHPDAISIIHSMETSGEKVIEKIMGEQPTPIIFLKHMTHHLVDLDWSFMLECVNVILTRDPHEMLPSYAKQIAKPTLVDVGYQKHLEVVDYLAKFGEEPIVLDSKTLLLEPEKVLKKLCYRIGIPFDAAMLSWSAGPRKEDGVWAKDWYENVHQSTGFKPYQAKENPFPEKLRPLLEECLPLYNALLANAV